VLANHIHELLRFIHPDVGLSTKIVVGGTDLPRPKRLNVHIVVGIPGALLHALSIGILSAKHLEYLVMDDNIQKLLNASSGAGFLDLGSRYFDLQTTTNSDHDDEAIAGQMAYSGP
jgi:hypothetical protein